MGQAADVRVTGVLEVTISPAQAIKYMVFLPFYATLFILINSHKNCRIVKDPYCSSSFVPRRIALFKYKCGR